MHVSVSAYEDAELLDGCLRSIREVLGDVSIQIVDGKYDTWPEGGANSTDATPQIADAHGAEYVAGGPYPRERDKHLHRVELAPDNQRTILIDADERLFEVNEGALESGGAYQPRIYNALTYGPHAVYWPRILPAGPNHHVQSINRWDAYLFDVHCEKTDAITIIHRHDLRDLDYRTAKYERFEREGRRGRYEDCFDQYLSDDWNATFFPCPECGRESMTRSQVTNYGDVGYSYVEACVARDGCHVATHPIDVGEWRYLPNDLERGFEEDPARLRIELMDAGCGFIRSQSPERMVEEFKPVIRIWVEEELTETREPDLFA